MRISRIKRFILLLIVAMVVTTIPAYADWTPNQTKANQMANIARSMGLPETNPIIKECQRIWWEEQEKVEAAAQNSKEQELQNFLNNHYADAVDLAGTMYAEARGLSRREMSMVCWCVLNRYDSGRFGSSIHNVLWAKSQFAHSNKRYSDNGTDLVWLAQDVLTRYWKEKNGEANVGRTLPQNYYFYYGDGHHNYFRQNNNGKGSYNFGLWDPYS